MVHSDRELAASLPETLAYLDDFAAACTACLRAAHASAFEPDPMEDGDAWDAWMDRYGFHPDVLMHLPDCLEDEGRPSYEYWSFLPVERNCWSLYNDLMNRPGAYEILFEAGIDPADKALPLLRALGAGTYLGINGGQAAGALLDMRSKVIDNLARDSDSSAPATEEELAALCGDPQLLMPVPKGAAALLKRLADLYRCDDPVAA